MPKRLLLVALFCSILAAPTMAATARVKADGTRLFPGPSIATPVVRVLNAGATLDVISVLGKWVRVRDPRTNQEGYVLAADVVVVGNGAGDINGCKYLAIGTFTYDPYGVSAELRKQAGARGMQVLQAASEVHALPAAEQYKACVVKANWSSQGLSGEISVSVLDAMSGIAIGQARAGGTAWVSAGRTVRSVVTKIYDQLHCTGYTEEAYLAKVRKLFPPRPTLQITESEMRAREIKTGLEGIWTESADQYRLAITKASGEKATDFYAVVLQPDSPAWQAGEIKAEFRATASPTVFTAWYFMSDKSRVGMTFVLDREVLLRGSANVDGRVVELSLIKIWPAAPTGGAGVSPDAVRTSGSGFLVSHTGLLATNWHVVKGANEIEVGFPEMNGRYQLATVALRDTSNDLAVLRLSDPAATAGCANLPFQLVPSNRVVLGQKVQTIGYPLDSVLGLRAKFSEGVVASKAGPQDDPRSFQISTPVQPGSSGSPLFDTDGNVVGVVVATLDAGWLYEAAGALPQNVSWAIKSDYLLNLLNMLPGETLATRATAFTAESAAKCVAHVRIK